jgi:hypothetical protein
MTRRTTGTLASTLVLVAVAVAGCGGSKGDPVAWTDDVCGALSGFITAATAQPNLNQNDPAAMVKGLGDYLGSTTAALDTSIKGLDAAGPSPVDGGDEYVSRLKNTLTQIRTSFDTARTQLAAVDTSSPESLQTALPAAVAPLQELSNLADPTEGLQANEELRAAGEKAPNCKKLSAG